MQSRLADTTFMALRRIWSDAGVIPSTAHWHAMEGGRSNPIWRVDLQDGTRLVCKLFTPNTATPLFANEGTREVLALRALEETKIAPELIAFQETIFGETLIYRHIEGPNWSGDMRGLAKLIAQLHMQPKPAGLPTATLTRHTMVTDGLSMGATTKGVIVPPPNVKVGSTRRQAFLHGDIVPGNILSGPDGLRLIDWQCPVIGDPCIDLAIFLSPAMQVVYGHRPLTDAEVEEFLATYETHSGDPHTVARYLDLAPLFHWRMAVYCQWKTAQGDQDYAGMSELELAALKQR